MQNPDAAHYCARCGGLLLSETGSTQTTMSFSLEHETDAATPAVGDVQAGGPALVVRAGDRAGEHFLLGDSRVTIGRSSGADILLDDANDLSDDDLRARIQRCTQSEREVSFKRRILHGHIDLLRAEITARLRERDGEASEHLAASDVDQLSEILSHRGPPLELPAELERLD